MIFNSYVSLPEGSFFFIFDKQNLCHICHDHLVYSGDMSSIAGIERNHGSRSLLHHWNVSLIARFSSAFSSDVPHKNLFHFSFTGATGCFSPLSCAARCIDRFQWYFAQRHHVSRDQPLHGCLGLEGLVEPPGCLKKNMGNSHGNSPMEIDSLENHAGFFNAVTDVLPYITVGYL